MWVAILRLAYDWSFPEVKALAIRELERKTINLVERIILYQECKVDQSLLVPLFAKLCSRDEPLSTEESLRLGVETTVRIFQARERLRSSSLDGLKSPLPNNVDHTNVMQVIEEVWGGDTNGASGGWVIIHVFCHAFTYSFFFVIGPPQGSSSAGKANGSANGGFGTRRS